MFVDGTTDLSTALIIASVVGVELMLIRREGWWRKQTW
jgi:hypothetical protein